MARTPIRRLPSKLHSIWTRKWGYTIQYPSQNLDTTMKKLLIYYPKNPRDFLPITSEIRPTLFATHSNLKERLRQLYRKVVSRYKQELMIHQNIDISSSKLLTWPACRTARSLRFFQPKYLLDEDPEDLEDFYKGCAYLAKKSIKTNKRLRNLELDLVYFFFAKIFKDLKYVQSLQSLQINNFPDVSLDEFKKAIFGSRLSLETVTLTGKIELNNLIERFRVILELPKLKRLNIDCEIRDFDIGQIPFQIFHKRNISYDIRVTHDSENFQFTLPTEMSLAKLDFLGLNFNKNWISWFSTWDISLEEYVKIQQSVKRSLFISRPASSETEISELFLACKNIRVLDIILSNASFNGHGYQNLKYLKNLQHIFIQLCHLSNLRTRLVRELPACTQILFENLKDCAQNLKSVSLHIYGESDPEKGINAISDFFETCSETLKYVTLKFTFDMYCEGKNINLFYTALHKLKSLTGITLIYDGYTDDEFAKHSDGLKTLLSNQLLQELRVSAKSISPNLVTLDLSSLRNLQNLSLEYSTLNIDSEFLASFPALVKTLRNLEISLNSLDKQTWYKLLNKLDSLQILESLKLRISKLEVSEKDAVSELRFWIKKSPSLKLLVFGQGVDPIVVNIFVKDHLLYAKEAVNNFIGRGIEGVPNERVHKVYIV